jgi:hypothetical protein
MSNPDVDLKVSHNIICNHCRNNIAEIFQESGEFCLHVGRRELVLMSSDEVSSNRGINERTIAGIPGMLLSPFGYLSHTSILYCYVPLHR